MSSTLTFVVGAQLVIIGVCCAIKAFLPILAFVAAVVAEAALTALLMLLVVLDQTPDGMQRLVNKFILFANISVGLIVVLTMLSGEAARQILRALGVSARTIRHIMHLLVARVSIPAVVAIVVGIVLVKLA